LTVLSLSDPPVSSALQTAVSALRKVADYKLDTALDERLRDLGERKEFLGPDEHAELKALVAFTEQRTIEKLEAQLALQRLLSVCPELANQP
jgi:hypothetical protein